ncbi:hypothetical protein AYO41_01005 [Verrucomicrobia bacterium SCGC AG-212-E04]|nr:hypothetical protein AYO41_01005 [Verrucomicrobia bacterium SCGC AG-212-E04]
MTLLNPAAFIFAALVPIVVLLYLLKIRRRDVVVSTLRFWQQLATDNRRRNFWQKLRRPLSLLLQLLLLALVLFALARPELGAFSLGGGSSTIVVLDARARMQAREANGDARFAEARTVAAGFLRRASPSHQVALLVAGARPRIAVPLSSDDAPLLAALQDLAPDDAAGSLEEALALSRELLSSRPAPRRVVVITDESAPPRPDSASATIEWIAVGAPRENVGITRLATRRLASSSADAEILLEIVNHGASRRAGNVELAFDGRVFDSRPYDLAPGQRQTEVFASPPLNRLPANARGWITARWLPADGQADALALDDVAFAVAPLPRPRRVLLVTTGNPFLERCLAADDSIRFDLLAPAAFDPATATNFDVVIFAQPESRGSERLATLPAGNFLFIRQSPLGLNEGELDRPIVTEADIDDPLLRLADLREVNFLRGVKLPFDARRGMQRLGLWRITAPLRSLDSALILAGEREPEGGRGAQRFVALAFGVIDSDLPLRIAFPLFIHNAVQWLAGGDSTGLNALRAGETLRLRPGESVENRPRANPTTEITGVQRLSGEGAFAATRNGFHLRRDAAGVESWLAVNTFDDDTSNLSRAAASATFAGGADGVATSYRGSVFRAWPPWVYLAALALFLSALEWLLYHRRRTE